MTRLTMIFPERRFATPLRAGATMRWMCALVALAVGGACSIGGQSGDERTRPESAEGFIEYVREDMQDHEWQSILSSSDPAVYQDRVVRERVTEVQFFAELFGLSRPGNEIKEGDELDWPDLERVDSVAFFSAGDTVPPFRFSGQALLSGGGTRRLDTQVRLVQGRFVLAPPAE